MLLRATSDHDFRDILRLAPIRLMASGCTTSSNRRGGGVPDGSCWTDATTVVVRQWQVVPLIFWMRLGESSRKQICSCKSNLDLSILLAQED